MAKAIDFVDMNFVLVLGIIRYWFASMGISRVKKHFWVVVPPLPHSTIHLSFLVPVSWFSTFGSILVVDP
jgi:hypothetical protein